MSTSLAYRISSSLMLHAWPSSIASVFRLIYHKIIKCLIRPKFTEIVWNMNPNKAKLQNNCSSKQKNVISNMLTPFSYHIKAFCNCSISRFCTASKRPHKLAATNELSNTKFITSWNTKHLAGTHLQVKNIPTLGLVELWGAFSPRHAAFVHSPDVRLLNEVLALSKFKNHWSESSWHLKCADAIRIDRMVDHTSSFGLRSQRCWLQKQARWRLLGSGISTFASKKNIGFVTCSMLPRFCFLMHLEAQFWLPIAVQSSLILFSPWKAQE